MAMRQREGVWCPGSCELEDCEVLFIGDSLFRYLNAHIPDRIVGLVPGVRFLPGLKLLL